MKCENCGIELPENVTACPECGAVNESLADTPRRTGGTESTAVRSQTVPQRPRTAYPERKSERKDGDAIKGRHGKTRVVILVLVIALLLCAAVYVGYRILQNGREEPSLGEPENGSSGVGDDGQGDVTPPASGDGEGQDGEDEPAAPTVYDLAGVWVWDADTALMKETVWNFAADGTLTIHYFGLGDPENPFDAWPDTYSYDKDTATLTLAGEEIELTWKNETSFTMNSTKLGICDAKKTDEAHIPTGAADIREVESGNGDAPENGENGAASSVYIFKDSDSRYLSKSECEARTSDELRIARNEIYARHGRLFDTEDLQAYFNKQDWYEGTISPEDFDYTVLNDYERSNVFLMKSIEDARKANA